MNSYASATQKSLQTLNSCERPYLVQIAKRSQTFQNLKHLYSLRNNSETSPKLESKLYEKLSKRDNKISTNIYILLVDWLRRSRLKKTHPDHSDPQTSDTRIKARYIKNPKFWSSTSSWLKNCLWRDARFIPYKSYKPRTYRGL